MKLAWQVNPIIEWLKRWLDIDEHPIKALGIVGASVACLGYWIVGLPLVSLVRHRPEEMGLHPDGMPMPVPPTTPTTQGSQEPLEVEETK